MAMTEEEILREAARIRAARRRRVERTCKHCGTTYDGLVHSWYCSDRCRVAASRQRRAAANSMIDQREDDVAPMQRNEESLDEYHARVRAWTKRQWAPAEVPPEVERKMAVIERLDRTRERIMRVPEKRSPTAAEILDGAARLLEERPDLFPDRDRQLPTELALERARSTIEEMVRVRDEIMKGRVFEEDSTEILRREREARSDHLASL